MSTMELKERFFVMAGRVEQLGVKIDPSNANSLKDARGVLIEIIKDLQGMVVLGEVSASHGYYAHRNNSQSEPQREKRRVHLSYS